jgi:UDP-N-acetyl-D-glucosamine dehydrogenase
MCDQMGIDVWEVVKAARTKPFGFMPFYPGPGLGGHCIPIDPFYLSWKARQSGFEARFIELAGHVNSAMPEHVVTKIGDALNTQRKSINGSAILVLGAAYKKNIDDVRESPALDVMHLLHQRGASINYADPHVPKLRQDQWSGGFDLTAVDLATVALNRYDCVVILTDHACFDYGRVAADARLIVDTRDAIKGVSAAPLFKLGSGQQHQPALVVA